MSREIVSKGWKPSLQFRYQAHFPDQETHLKFYGRSIDLPKWSKETGWKNPIKIGCYHYENITVNELSKLNTENIKLVIQILDPDGSTSIYEWRLLGNILSIDYGNLDWGVDDCTQATILFQPSDCLIAFQNQ